MSQQQQSQSQHERGQLWEASGAGLLSAQSLLLKRQWLWGILIPLNPTGRKYTRHCSLSQLGHPLRTGVVDRGTR